MQYLYRSSARLPRKPASRLVWIITLFTLALFFIGCAILPPPVQPSPDQFNLKWDDLPAEFVPVSQSSGLDGDGFNAFESVFANQLPHSGTDLVVTSKLVVSDPQYWRSYLLATSPGDSTRLDGISVGSESAVYKLSVSGKSALRIIFLKGNTFATLTVIGTNDGQALDLAKSLADKLAARIPDSLAAPKEERSSLLTVDQDHKSKMITSIAFGRKTDSGQIDPVLDLVSGNYSLCFKIQAIQAPKKYTTAILNNQSNTYAHKTQHFSPTGTEYASCEFLHALPGNYTFAIWHDDKLVYTTIFSVR